jgi:hypothetical protein
MKSIRIARLLGIVVIIALLMVAIPASPVLGTYDVVLSSTSGQIGATINITGTNFPASTLIYFCFSNQAALINQYVGSDVTVYSTIASATTTPSGTLTGSFLIPSKFSSTNTDVTYGVHYIYATVFTAETPPRQLIVNSINFTVVGGDISVNPQSGIVESPLVITGTNFAATQQITIQFDGTTVIIEEGDTSTNSAGNFVSTIYIPESKAGLHDIAVTVAGYTTTTHCTVEPDIILFPQSGKVDDTISISGTGFAKRPKLVDIFFDNTYVQQVQTDTLGSFYIEAFVIPDLDLPQGTYYIEAEDEDENLAVAAFTLNVAPPTTTPPTTTPPTTPPDDTDLNISYQTNYVGSSVAIGGSGFTPNATAEVSYDGEEVATTTVESNGAFLVTFHIPPSTGGDHIISVTDGTNTAQLTYTVETTPPSTPPPLLPTMGAKVRSPYIFDWEDVTDDSLPVTYTLQVSSDTGFSTTSIVLEKTELELSEYTLTEQEELVLAGKETPYYWRIKAVDAASNESAWTGLGEFYVSPPFSFPTWAIIILSILGALIFFGVGYWLGRRTAFFY